MAQDPMISHMDDPFSEVPQLLASPPTPAQFGNMGTSSTILHPDSKFNLLLAIAEDHLAESAVRVTNVLAHERGACPQVVQVFDPAPYAAHAPDPSLIILAESLLGPDIAETKRRNLRTILMNVCGHHMSWPIKILFGSPASCIIRESERSQSQLIVLGLRAHGHMNRLLRSETALQVIENVSCPVLAVTQDLSDVPHKVVVAIDFSRASIRAAYLAARMISSNGVLSLVYVQPQSTFLSMRAVPNTEGHYHDGLSRAFANLAKELGEFSNVCVTTHILEGDPATALLDYADRIDTDLIALGSQRHSIYHKLTVGTVTRAVVRDARRSVLIMPPKTESHDEP